MVHEVYLSRAETKAEVHLLVSLNSILIQIFVPIMRCVGRDRSDSLEWGSEFEVRSLEFEVWSSEFGVRSLGFGVRSLGFEVWSSKSKKYPP